MADRPLVPRRTWLQGAAVAVASTWLPSAFAAPDKGRAWLGVELSKGEGGVLAKRVMRGSPAEKGGIKSADLLLSLDGKAVAAAGEVVRIVADKGPGSTVKVKVRRAKGELTVPVTLAEYPGEEEALRLDKVGTFAPAWKGAKPAQGDVADVKKLRGRVVVVDFWASWCAACRATVPQMNDLHQRFGAQGLTVRSAHV
jgi:thiol-disulfide isomerase/thioredoxin